MIAALLIGRKGSVGFPGKNLHLTCGHPLAYYPMMAAQEAPSVNKVFLSTDCPDLKALAAQHNIEIIERPPELCTGKALGEDVFVHGYYEIKRRLGELNMIVLLHCNSATVNVDLIEKGINVLRQCPQHDSAVSVSKYNMWSPLRARKIGENGLLEPFVPLETFGNPSGLNCDRNSQGDVYFADMSVSIVRPHCLEHIERGMLPQKWMGQKIYPLIQEAGCDVDCEFQIAQTEYWLRKNASFSQRVGNNDYFESRKSPNK